MSSEHSAQAGDGRDARSGRLPDGAPLRGVPLRRVAVAAVVSAVAVATLVAGPGPFLVFTAAVYLVVYLGVVRLFEPEPVSRLPAGLGAAAVVAFCWVGYRLGPEDLPWVLLGLLVVGLVTRIVAVELRRGSAERVTAEMVAVAAAAATVGMLGSHLLLVRSLPDSGLAAAAVLVGMVGVAAGTAALAGRFVGRHPVGGAGAGRTWEGIVAGFAATLAVGLAVGLALDPPFRLGLSLGLAASTGVLVPLGAVAVSALRLSAQSSPAPGPVPWPHGLALAGSLLFSAPFFYWSLRIFGA